MVFMRWIFMLPVTVAVIFYTSGCVPKVAGPSLHSVEGIDIYAKDSSMRGTYVVRPGNHRFCLEPIVDVARTSSENVELGIGSGVTNEEVGENTSEGAMGLGGMSPEVLITSILMYRACELSTNLDADKELTFNIYSRFLDTIEKISTDIGANVGTVPVSSGLLPPNNSGSTNQSASDNEGDLGSDGADEQSDEIDHLLD